MKVVENTDSRLVLVHRPWFLAIAVWAMGLAAVSGALTGEEIGGTVQQVLVATVGIGFCAIAWWAFPMVRVVFDRESEAVGHEERRLFHTKRRQMPLSRVERAAIESDRKDGARLTRLILVTSRGPAPLEIGFGRGDRSAAETAINEWLTRPVGAAVG